MGTSVSFNGTSYTVPAVGDRRWGTNVTALLISLAANALSRAGGNFTLTADANFSASGGTFGIVSKYFKSVSANIAQSGVVRFANNEGIAWRNFANGADIVLKVNASDQIEIDGVAIPSAATTVVGPASAVDNRIARYDGTTGKLIQDSAVAIDDSGNLTGVGSIDFVGTLRGTAFTASRALATNGTKDIVTTSVTATEQGYLSGVTSAIQTQINTKVTGPASAVDNRVARFDSTTGKLIQESAVAIDDSGNMTGVGSVDFVGTLTGSALTASRVLVTNGSKVIASSSVTGTELGYLSGVTAPTGTGALVLGTSPTITTPSIVGRSSGVAISATHVGEKLTGTFLTPTFVSGNAVNIMSLSLTAGVWLVYGKAQSGTAGSSYTRFACSLSLASATQSAKSEAADNYGSNDKDREVVPGTIYVNTTGTTVYLVGTCTFTGAAPASSSGYNELFAVRVA